MRRTRIDCDVELPHLWTFMKAAEIGSFTRAGKEISLTQAAVSQRVHALEQLLGTPLFRREAGRVTLTDAGHALHGFARRIFALHREAREAVSGLPVPINGELRLAASSVPGECLLPDMLPAFGRKWPHIKLCATVTDSRAVLQQVEHGHVDLGLVGLRENRGSLTFEKIAVDE